MNNRAFSRDDSAALIYRFNDTRLNSVSFAGLPQRAGYRHYDCDSCCATDLCAFRELTVLLRTEDVLGIEREWCHSQQWFGELPLSGRRLRLLVLQCSVLLEPDLGDLLSGLSGCGAEVTVSLLTGM
ncbi:MAG: hypothetical protein CMI00_01105 [Oceanospirillaceae bacterium]|nr:hypothetical protein [Oceanospirillaceae bacterium]